MIRTSTVVYVVILLGLIGAYFYLKNRPQSADIEVTAEPGLEVTYLFGADEGTPSSISIRSRSGASVEIARDPENYWMLKQPLEGNAAQGAAEAAATQISTLQVLDRLSEIDPKIIGLDVPEYVLTVKFTDGAERTTEIGSLTPTESGYYARDATGEVVIVGRSGIDALLGLLDNPPYQETPTPSPVPPTEEIP